jgi:hypothetical protein
MNSRLLFLPTPARTRLMLSLLGLIILVSGLAVAASIWVAQDRLDRQTSAGGGDTTSPLPLEDSRRYTHDVELYYGQTGILVDKWRRWWEEWTHGKPLARVMAVASLILASGLFYAAANRPHPTRLPMPSTPQGAAGSKPAAAEDQSARPGQHGS